MASVMAERDRLAEECAVLKRLIEEKEVEQQLEVAAIRTELRLQVTQHAEAEEKVRQAHQAVRLSRGDESMMKDTVEEQYVHMKELQVALMNETQEKLTCKENIKVLKGDLANEVMQSRLNLAKIQAQQLEMREMEQAAEKKATDHAIEVAQMAAEISELQRWLNRQGGKLTPPSKGLPMTSSQLSSDESSPLATPRTNFKNVAGMLESGFTGTSIIGHEDDFSNDAVENLKMASSLVESGTSEGTRRNLKETVAALGDENVNLKEEVAKMQMDTARLVAELRCSQDEMIEMKKKSKEEEEEVEGLRREITQREKETKENDRIFIKNAEGPITTESKPGL